MINFIASLLLLTISTSEPGLEINIIELEHDELLKLKYSVTNKSKDDIWVSDGVDYEKDNRAMLFLDEEKKEITIDVSSDGIPKDVDFFAGIEGTFTKIKPNECVFFSLHVKKSEHRDYSDKPINLEEYKKLTLKLGIYREFPMVKYREITKSRRIFNFYQDILINQEPITKSSPINKIFAPDKSEKVPELDVKINGIKYDKRLILDYSVTNISKQSIWISEGINYGKDNNAMLSLQKTDKRMIIDVSESSMPEGIYFEVGLEGTFREIKPGETVNFLLNVKEFQFGIEKKQNIVLENYDTITLKLGYYINFPVKKFREKTNGSRIFNFYQKRTIKEKIIQVDSSI